MDIDSGESVEVEGKGLESDGTSSATLGLSAVGQYVSRGLIALWADFRANVSQRRLNIIP